jgi:hypothetical protein
LHMATLAMSKNFLTLPWRGRVDHCPDRIDG